MCYSITCPNQLNRKDCWCNFKVHLFKILFVQSVIKLTLNSVPLAVAADIDSKTY